MKKKIKNALWLPRGIYSLLSDVYKRYIMPKRRNLFGHYGEYATIQTPCFITEPQSCYINDYSVIRYGLNIINTLNVSVQVGKYCVLGPNCTLITGNHAQTLGLPQIVGCMCHVNDYDASIEICDSVWLGANVTVLPGVKIGRGAIVGCGSLVNKDIPPYAVAVGTPAKIIATTFSIDEILKHEKVIYSVGERYSYEALAELYNSVYKDLKSIGHDTIPKEKVSEIERMTSNIGISLNDF